MLIGDITYNEVNYVLGLNDKKNSQQWILYSSKDPNNQKSLRYLNALNIQSTSPKVRNTYIVASIMIQKNTGVVSEYDGGRLRVLRNIKDAFVEASTYAYPKDTVQESNAGQKFYTIKNRDALLADIKKLLAKMRELEKSIAVFSDDLDYINGFRWVNPGDKLDVTSEDDIQKGAFGDDALDEVYLTHEELIDIINSTKVRDYAELNKKEDSINYLLMGLHSDYLNPYNISKFHTLYEAKFSLGKFLMNNIKTLKQNYNQSEMELANLQKACDEETGESVDVKITNNYTAKHGELSIHKEYIDGLLVNLAFSNKFVSTRLLDMKLTLPKLNLVEIDRSAITDLSAVTSIDYVNMDTLRLKEDLSWYEVPKNVFEEYKKKIEVMSKIDKKMKMSTVCIMDRDDKYVKFKDYKAVHNIKEFNKILMKPLLNYILDCMKKGIKAVLALDTEANGLSFYNLSKENPILSSIVSFQCSWKDDQGVAVWLDMEHFESVDMDYALSNFTKLFREERGMISTSCDGVDYLIDRDTIILVGHNTVFDSKVFLHHGYEVFFDMDTLQMAFSLAPSKYVSKGLKDLTVMFLGYKYPSLSDLLGKGNEDKFKYIVDEEVAQMYSCTDTDSTRKVYFILRAMMTDKMYKSIARYDSYTWFICAKMEYEGLTLQIEEVKREGRKIRKKIETIEEFIYKYVGTILSHKYGFMEENNDYYKFKLNGADVRYVMYDLLGYPVQVLTKSDLPAVDSKAIKKHLMELNKNGEQFLQKDVYVRYEDEIKDPITGKITIEKFGEPEILIDKNEFNQYKYALSYLLKLYKTMEKEYTGYYKPFESNNLEGKLFKKITPYKAETRRILCALQTIKKNLKALVVPPKLPKGKKAIDGTDTEYYICDYDYNQIEARLFVSEAHDEAMILKLNGYEADYHTEGAAILFAKNPWEVLKDERSKAKTANFGYPYGLSDMGLCEGFFTIVNDVNMVLTRNIIEQFEHRNPKTIKLLNGYREAAKVNNPNISDDLKEMWGLYSKDGSENKYQDIGTVYNRSGFFRYFALDKAKNNKGLMNSIGRQAGNFPIQSFAADLFKLGLRRLYITAREWGIADKIKFLLPIHDECLMAVHKSVDPRLMVKLLYTACQFSIKGHTKYFIGVNFSKDSWLGAKSDKLELNPGVMFDIVKDFDNIKLNDWTTDPNEVVIPYKIAKERNRLKQVIEAYCPDYEYRLDLDELFAKFTNYTVRGYIGNYTANIANETILGHKFTKEEDGVIGFLSLLGCDNSEIKVGNRYVKVKDLVEDADNLLEITDVSFDDIDDDFISEEDNYFSFDGLSEDYFDTYDININSGLADSTCERLRKYIKGDTYGGYNIIIPNYSSLDGFLDKLELVKSSSGKRVTLETATGIYELNDTYDIDKEIDELEDYLVKSVG